MAKIVYRQMPARRELPQQITAPGQKLGCKSPRVGANFGANPRGCAGGWLWQKSTAALFQLKTNQMLWLFLEIDT